MQDSSRLVLADILEDVDHSDWDPELDFWPDHLYGKYKFYWPEEGESDRQLAVITTVFDDFRTDQVLLCVCFRYKYSTEPPSWCVYQRLGDKDHFSPDEARESATGERLSEIGRNCLAQFETEVLDRFPVNSE